MWKLLSLLLTTVVSNPKQSTLSHSPFYSDWRPVCSYSSLGGLLLTQENFPKTGTLVVEAVPLMQDGLVQAFGLVSLEQDVGVLVKFDRMEAESNSKLILEIRYGQADQQKVEVLSANLDETGNGMQGDKQLEFKLEVGTETIGVFMDDNLIIDSAQVDSQAGSALIQTSIEQMHAKSFSSFQGFIQTYSRSKWEPSEEQAEYSPPALFVETFKFTEKINIQSSFSDWDFDADFRNTAENAFDEIDGKILDEFHVKSFPPLKHKTLGSLHSESLISYQNLFLAQGSDEMFLRTTPNMFDSNQKRSWSPQREEFSGRWTSDYQLQVVQKPSSHLINANFHFLPESVQTVYNATLNLEFNPARSSIKTSLCYKVDMTRTESQSYLSDGMTLKLTLLENKYPYTELNTKSWILQEPESCQEIKLRINPESYYFTQNRLDSLAFVLSVEFSDNELDKNNLVLNTTLYGQFECDTDYYEKEITEILKETKTIKSDDGYELNFILAIVIPIIVILVLLALIVKICLQMKTQGSTVNKNQGIIDEQKEEMRKQRIIKNAILQRKQGLQIQVQEMQHTIEQQEQLQQEYLSQGTDQRKKDKYSRHQKRLVPDDSGEKQDFNNLEALVGN